jgi:hypothetical protein
MKHLVNGGHGEYLPAVKSVRARVFAPGNRGSKLLTFHAPPGRAWAPVDVDKILDRVADTVEKQFPAHEYEMLALGQGYYNFICRGEKKAQGTLSPVSA